MLVHFWETKDTSTGARAPIVGRLRFRATRSRVIAGTPDEEVLPEPFSVRLDDDGKASVPLAATSGSWAWEVSLYGDAGWGPFYVAVGAGAEADWPDLVRVDPATLAPAQPAVPAWEAAVSAVEGYAQAAADSAALAASEADSVEQTIADEVQDWLAANPPAAGDDGREVEFGLSATHVQWRYVGDVAWTDLIALSSLIGATGATPELQATTSHVQWREPGGAWTDLVALADLRGPQGDPGDAATTHTHTAAQISDGTVTGRSLITAATATAARTAISAAPALGADDNYVTDAEKTKLANLSGTNTGDQDLSGLMPKTQTLNAQTGSYTLVVADATKLVTVTVSAAANVTVPANVFSAGQTVEVLDAGTARITFVAGSGMTLNATPSLVSRAQYSGHMIKFLSATSAVVIGDLA